MAGIKNYTKKSAGEGQKILSLSNYHPGDSEILNWCSARSVLGEGESPSLVMAGHPSSDGVTITISYGVDVLLHQPASSYPRPAFLIGLIKTEFDFIVRSVETGLRRWTQVVALISVDAYPFWLFKTRPVTLRTHVFWLHCAAW